MVAITKLYPSETPAPQSQPKGRGGSIARLKALHSEAEETARLANILGRSLYAGLALPVLAILTVALSVEMSPGPQLIWCLFVGAVSVAILVAYRHAMRQPFERSSLKHFAKDLSAILLFAGFAWGSGAFLALPVGTQPIALLVFASAPAVIIAYLLRDREALFLFLAPVTVLSASACLLKPFAGGLWAALLTILAAGVIAGATLLYERLTGEKSKPAMLALP
ncbi:MAG: hypothetical protein P4L57_14775 [Rhizomicrobium sp.]|nr:hypothetical protein [Rhizomicrobium sp.]